MTLCNIRKARKLTTEDVASALNISRAHYTHLENGTRSLTEKHIVALSKVLEVSPEVIRANAEELSLNNLVPNSWLTSIKINGKPLVKAFSDDMKKSLSYSSLSEDELTERLVKFIFFHIEHSVRQELKENRKIIEFISRKLGHNQIPLNNPEGSINQ